MNEKKKLLKKLKIEKWQRWQEAMLEIYKKVSNEQNKKKVDGV